MNSSAEIKALFSILRKGGNYIEAAFEEAELLGISVSEADLHVFSYAANKFPDSVEALEFLRLLNDETYHSIVSNQKDLYKSFLERQSRQLAQATDEENRRKVEELEANRFAEVKGLIEAIIGKIDLEFKDYTVIARHGDEVLALRQPVARALRDGWVPIGGVHVAGPIDNGTMLFSQAMGLPKHKPNSKTHDY